jgi:hypothetical protein
MEYAGTSTLNIKGTISKLVPLATLIEIEAEFVDDVYDI